MSDDCIFCRIGAGMAPSHEVYASKEVKAFLDINPVRLGHVQIVPRQHYPYFDDLPPRLAAEMFTLAQRLAPVLKQLFGVPRVGLLFSGGDIRHAHGHVIPLAEASDITSRRYIVEEVVTFTSTPRVPDDVLATTAANIRRSLEAG